jgi:hypothetical protein
LDRRVVGGRGELAGDHAVEVLDQLVLGGDSPLGRLVAIDEDPGAALEEVVIGVGDAEQVADDQRRHGQRECLDEVDRPRAGQQRVDALVHDPLDRRALWPGGITVFTASHWTATHVNVALSDERPIVELDAFDHTVEAGITLPGGLLQIGGPEETSEACIELPGGSYALLVCGSGFDTTNAFDEDGADAYAFWLWPGPELRRRVLRDGLTWMDRRPLA